jgi:4-hydroxybenzoate polyprenyltransferase/phosphoserine phosphatase
MNDSVSIPLCVDLDGTLVKLDTLHQAVFLLLRRRPASILQLPGWITKGKAHLKDQVMQRVSLDAHVLPYHQEFLTYLQEQHQRGRPLVLATASNYRTADAVAEHLGIFSEILSSNADTNLRHERKLEAIKKRFPKFGYAGNDVADFPIWEEAGEVILVNPSNRAYARFAEKATHVFRERRPVSSMLFKAMRCQQWLKNLLIFAPMLLAHQFSDHAALRQAFCAFSAFSFAASAIYVLNDLFDLSADQHHPRKKQRPFASGNLSIQSGALLIPLLAVLSLVFSLFLPFPFFTTLLVYFVMTTLYSWRLKQVVIADVIVLALLYTLRIIAGACATGTVVSSWFIAFSIFLFLSLALVKRFAELHEVKDTADHVNVRRERGYKIKNLPALMIFGMASGYLAVLVFTLYLNSTKVSQLYAHPALLWLFCLLLLYWITRIWTLAWRGNMHDDPLAFAAKDLQTYAVGLLSILVFMFAI